MDPQDRSLPPEIHVGRTPIPLPPASHCPNMPISTITNGTWQPTSKCPDGPSVATKLKSMAALWSPGTGRGHVKQHRDKASFRYDKFAHIRLFRLQANLAMAPPTTMTAVGLSKTGASFDVIEEFRFPVPSPSPTQILIKASYAIRVVRRDVDHFSIRSTGREQTTPTPRGSEARGLYPCPRSHSALVSNAWGRSLASPLTRARSPMRNTKFADSLSAAG